MGITDGINYTQLLLASVMGWVLVPLWQRLVDNLSFTTLGLNRRSLLHTFVIAVVATVAVVLFVYWFGDVTDPSGSTSIIVPPITPEERG